MLSRAKVLMATFLMPQTAMGWTSSGPTNAALVNNLIRDGVIKDTNIERAMRAVDRADFCPPGSRPYDDSPMPIGFGQTISAPHMHAHALELLKDHLRPGARVLDCGVGSGYLAAAMAQMIGDEGRVIGIDYPELIDIARRNLAKSWRPLLEGQDARISLRAGDGWQGVPDAPPFSAIHVGAAAASVPSKLLDQLSPGGRMLIPVGPEGGNQVLRVIDKLPDGTIRDHPVLGVRYVPLVPSDEKARRESF